MILLKNDNYHIVGTLSNPSESGYDFLTVLKRVPKL